MDLLLRTRVSKYCLVVWYVSVYKVCKSRIRRTNIVCNDLTNRPSERVRKYKVCGQTNRQTDTFAITETETVIQTGNTRKKIVKPQREVVISKFRLSSQPLPGIRWPPVLGPRPHFLSRSLRGSLPGLRMAFSRSTLGVVARRRRP